MNIDPKHLIQLAEIIDSNSFSEAAFRLNTSQSALSRTIVLLEQRLGSKLFDRRRKPAVPTDLAITLGQLGTSIKLTTNQASIIGEQTRQGTLGLLKVGVPPFLCNRKLSGIVSSFLHAYTDVKVILMPDYAPVLRKKLLDNELDVVITPFEFSDDNAPLSIQRLSRIKHGIVCRHGHPLLLEDSIQRKQLEQASWISHLRDSRLYFVMKMMLESIGVEKINIRLETGSSAVLFNVLQNTDFLAVLSVDSIEEQLESGTLALLPTQCVIPEVYLVIMIDRRRFESPLMRRFINCIRDHYS